ncbi:MAG: hypothetical protein AAGD25_16155 [Cyanobacteria bacterium P01_F01_bin.150]
MVTDINATQRLGQRLGQQCVAQYQDSEMHSSIDRCAQKYRKMFCDRPISWDHLQPMNPLRGVTIANYFEALHHTPDNPETKVSYEQMTLEVQQQYEFSKHCMGIQFEPWFSRSEPYPTSCSMFEDVHQNHHLYFLPTREFFGESTALANNNYMLRPTGVLINGYELLINDMFRAIHDLLGHAMQGYSFGPKGEENAWYEHLQFFSPLARPAITTETRGQNTWVNYGPHLRDRQGGLLAKTDPEWLPPSKRPFADQKVGLLPPEVSGVSLMCQGDSIWVRQLEGWTPNLEDNSLLLAA